MRTRESPGEDPFPPSLTNMKFSKSLPLVLVPLLLASSASGQLRRPGIVTVEREDRTSSRLVKEDGAIYLEEMMVDEVFGKTTSAAPIYSTLSADRWLGNLIPGQKAVLLAVSEKAYRVRAQAKQGQVAGWVSKAAISGFPEGFEENLREFHARWVVVKELIENHQVALGMTVEEVTASIGPPDKRTSKITGEGRTDALEYISNERVPQSGLSYDSFGRPVPTTQYVEVESGRVTIEFSDDMVTAISETEGIDLAMNGAYRVVPRPVVLF